MNEADFINIMKRSGFTEKEVVDLLFIEKRDSSNLEKDVKHLAGIFYRVIFGLLFSLSVMFGSLFDITFEEGEVFVFLIYILAYLIIWYIAPLKISYKSHRMYKEFID